ncbi:hypothetical protein [Candidatus Kryptobacter tengchongensis]|uniref:hypothetical protein n=1 Tax=Kryptobacter tengchongensis TaxID=1643429 RepID=UPI00070766F7|nr:hypothetical protein [Candidatus Kryptobacter tengchongensis]CUS90373.1 hypothetical protein JGI20_01334 [Candidatus Kryptobacter tengchongensis]
MKTERGLFILTLVIISFYFLFRISYLQKLVNESEKKLNELERYLKLDTSLIGKKLELKNNFRDYYGKIWTSAGFKDYSFICFILIVGGCRSCFEDEIDIWSKLFYDFYKLRRGVIAVNVGLRDDLMLYLLKAGQIPFPVLRDNGEFREFIKNLNGYEVIAILVDSNLRVIKVHFSERGKIEKTLYFVKYITNFNF